MVKHWYQLSINNPNTCATRANMLPLAPRLRLASHRARPSTSEAPSPNAFFPHYQIVRTEEWHVFHTTSSILLPHEERVEFLRCANRRTRAGPRCLRGDGYGPVERSSSSCVVTVIYRIVSYRIWPCGVESPLQFILHSAGMTQ